MHKITIGGRKIGDGEPCFIIAEAGVNHNGSLDLALRLIDAACDAHADAVKFQTFRADSVVTRSAETAQYQKENTGLSESQYDMIKKLEFSPENFRALSRYAEDKGILFLSSPFDLESVNLLADIGVAAFKVPSGEITNIPLLRVIAGKGKPVILSTGMATFNEIATAMEAMNNSGVSGVILLHCVTNYPADLQTLNLRVMETLRNRFDVPVGFSDHTLGATAAVIARTLGASVIEKHFTLDKTLPGPDHRASLEPRELKIFIEVVRDVDLALGDGVKSVSGTEEEIKTLVRKSLVAAVEIPCGMVIQENMVAIKRPGTGIAPEFYGSVLGKTAKTRIGKDSVITWEMIS